MSVADEARVGPEPVQQLAAFGPGRSVVVAPRHVRAFTVRAEEVIQPATAAVLIWEVHEIRVRDARLAVQSRGGVDDIGFRTVDHRVASPAESRGSVWAGWIHAFEW